MHEKRRYFKKLMLNGVPSILAFIGAIIAPMIWLRIAFVVAAIGIYVLVTYNQAGAMVDNDDFHERIGASVEYLKQSGIVPTSISVNGKKIKGDH
ncbi:hypothetical protein J5F27_14175 [Schleiferilactobacillus harbinensis]|uniref:hypothetical protein n=1 Tax=Schleiferilactobacillus harbinensis TaxID=304207 RepID=UPI001AB00DA8|nr:hypothetical protein [Schleiferilactobacillus harbinensis]MBO3093054.1 hypothetical protein [Schleiferilactobacillus harbinensis]